MISVVAPAHNEVANVRQLVAEIAAVLDTLETPAEIIIVDDGSSDGTADELERLLDEEMRLRVLTIQPTPRGTGHGQSAAFQVGFGVSRGDIIAVLDADLQNDPADLPAMLECLERTGADMVQGDRSQDRRDNIVRRVSTVVGRLTRRMLLGDTIRDTGCSLRVMRRDLALAIPLEFRGMHRFIPITARQLGRTVVEMPVRHRPRVAGSPKYGVWNRALPGLIDCFAVRWMRSRRRLVEATERKRTPEVVVTEATRSTQTIEA
jgi:glycosyltransferase involved in cell wall biosynthesis